MTGDDYYNQTFDVMHEASPSAYKAVGTFVLRQRAKDGPVEWWFECFDGAHRGVGGPVEVSKLTVSYSSFVSDAAGVNEDRMWLRSDGA